MSFKVYMLLCMLGPLVMFVVLSWLTILPVKRFFPDSEERHEAIMILHGAIVIGVFALMIQAVYGLWLLERSGL